MKDSDMKRRKKVHAYKSARTGSRPKVSLASGSVFFPSISFLLDTSRDPVYTSRSKSSLSPPHI